MDIGEDWPESEDESEMTEEYASEQNPVQIERKTSKVVQITPDQRKSSTGSQVRKILMKFINRAPGVRISVINHIIVKNS